MQAKTFADMITFTRAGTATFIDANGFLQVAAVDQPRFDYTNGRRQLLLEGSATNLVLNSVNGWGSFGGEVIVETGIDDPAGTLTARRVTAVNGTLKRIVSSCQAPTSGVEYTLSVWLRLVDGGANIYNPTDKQIVDISDQLELNEWVRVLVTAEAVDTPADSLQVRLKENSIIDVWAAQLEAGAYMTSCILTEGTTVTRPADKAQLAEPVAALLRGGEVSVLLQGQLVGPFENGRLISANSGWLLGQQGTAGDRINAYNGAAATIADLPVGTTRDGFGAAVSSDGSGTRLAANASSVAYNPAATKSSYGGFTAPLLGRSASGPYFSPGWYDQLVIWPFRMTDADLQAKAVPYA